MSLPVIDHAVLSSLRETLGDDVMQSLIGTYIDDTTSRMEQVSQYVDQNQTELLGREGHAIKGASANLGVARVAKSAETLQHTCEANDHNRLPSVVDSLKADVDDAIQQLKTLRAEL